MEEQAYLSYEEYFSQQRLYDYAEDVFSGWSLQDADISYDGTVLRLTDSKGTPMRDIATLKGYLFQTADKNWIYGISEASELVRVSYSGKIETLFADRTGLLRSLAEKEHAPIYFGRTDVRFFSSQGQTRTAALSLKLAERDIFRELTGFSPVLLLDDVLSELDPRRQEFVLNRISGGQVFITCCEEDRLETLLGGKVLHVENGKVV